MKIPNPYFESFPTYGKLYMEQILVNYSYPLLSVLNNGHGKRFLCFCFGTKGSQRWVVTNIDTETLVDLLKCKVPVVQAMRQTAEPAVLAIRDYSVKMDFYRQVTAETIPEEFLPGEDATVDGDMGEWDSYIRTLEGQKN